LTVEPNSYRDQLEHLLDGRLEDEERTRLKAQLAEHEGLRREYVALRSVKQALHRHASSAPSPPHLESRILAALDAEDEAREPQGAAARGTLLRMVARTAWALAAMLVVAAGIGIYVLSQDSLVHEVAQDYVQYRNRQLTMEFSGENRASLARFMDQHGFPPHERMLELGSAEFRFAGWAIDALEQRPAIFLAYESSADKRILCQMWPGSLAELPRGAEIHAEGQTSAVYVYDVDSLTLAFWQEGSILCVLASDIGRDKLVELAVAKANAAPPVS